MTMTLDRPTPAPVQLDLPFSFESAGVARRRLSQWFEDLGDVDERGERCDDARLLVTELVGNAVRHARPLQHDDDQRVIRVGWSCVPEAVLAIAVTDGGAVSSPQVVRAATGDTGGRGLAIVDLLARRWWVDDRREQTTVHAELPLD